MTTTEKRGRNENDKNNKLIENKLTLYARDVIDFSSQYGKEYSGSYTINNILSYCSCYPKYGDFIYASVLRTYGEWWKLSPSVPSFTSTSTSTCSLAPLFISKDFIELMYEQRLLIESVTIYETYHPGSVVSIYAFNYQTDRWTLIWSIFKENKFKTNEQGLKRKLPPKTSRKFKPKLERTNIYSE
jgi:F-box and leucine-rich repeat protein 4